MEDRYIAAIDLGSVKIALSVAKVLGNDIQLLYYKEWPSDGIRNSAVFRTSVSQPIKEAVRDAEKELNIKIYQVVVGLPRCDVRQETASASVDRNNPDESISLEEVENLKSIAQNEYPLNDRRKEELYGAIAQSFSADENFQLTENDIIGVISEKFEGNFKLFIGKKSAVKTLDKVFIDLGIAIARKFFTPDTIAKAVLTEEETENGVALIDLGGGVSSVSVYKNKILRHYAAIPFGGKTITGDIRSECSISESLAENIKKGFGACMPDRLQTLEEKIIQIEGDPVEGYKQIPVKYLSEIITARASEIIDAILYEIERSGLADSLRSGVVITGGGAKLCNIAALIKEMSGYNVRSGLSRRLFTSCCGSSVFDTSASNSIGMLLAAKSESMLNCCEIPEEGATAETETQPLNDWGNRWREESSRKEESVKKESASEQVESPAEPEVSDTEEKEKAAPKPKKESKKNPVVTWIVSKFTGSYDKVNEF